MFDDSSRKVEQLLEENEALKKTVSHLEQTNSLHQKLIERQQDVGQNRLDWLDYSPACTKIVDLDFNLKYMSLSGVKGLNIDNIEAYYDKPYPLDFYPDEFNQKMLATLNKSKETGEVLNIEGAVVDVNGNELWFHSTIIPMHNDKGQLDYFIVVSIDITERKQAEDRLRQLNAELEQLVENRTQGLKVANERLKLLSETDPLTMIANRREYSKRLQEEVSRAQRSDQPLSLLLIDIDYFKNFNDTFGHSLGDLVLKQVAEIIQNTLPRSIDFVARIGGEEFVVILSSTDRDGAALVAERIRNNVQANSIQMANESAAITISIGVSVQIGKHFTEDEIFGEADTALYRAKALGRNRVEIA